MTDILQPQSDKIFPATEPVDLATQIIDPEYRQAYLEALRVTREQVARRSAGEIAISSQLD